MPEMPDVIPNEPVEDEWGNKIRDRSLQRYTSITQRNSLNPTPTPGEISYLGDTGAIEVYHSGLWRATVPTGVILPYAGITPPTGYLICNGASILRATYPGLFAVIGTTYGSVDATHFTLPDLRQRFPIGLAASGVGDTLGEKGGSLATHKHGGPEHSHAVSGATGPDGAHAHAGNTAGATKGVVGGHVFWGTGVPLANQEEHRHAFSTDTEAAHDHSFADTSTLAGDGDTTGTAAVPPYIALHFVIRT